MSKEARKLYGLSGTPTVVVEARVRPMAFDHDGRVDALGRKTRLITTRAWCLKGPDGKVGFVNSYDGGLGANATVNWLDADKVSAKKLASYNPATPEELAANKWLQLVEDVSAVAAG